MISNTPPSPRYQEVRRDLLYAITSGRLPVGTRFPTDHELCQRFNVSRHTIREALRSLQEDGLIRRRPGSGSVVVSSRPERAGTYVLTSRSISDINSDAAQTELEILSKGLIRLGSELASVFDREEGERWLRLAGIRRREGHALPQCWVEMLIAERYAGVRHELHGRGAVHQQIQAHFGIKIRSVQQIIRAAIVPGPIAAKLEATEDGPGILVRRTYFDPRDNPFQIGLSLYPAERFIHESWISEAR